MLLSFFLCVPAIGQELEPLAPHPLDQVVKIEVVSGSPALREYHAEFEGVLHVWTTSELVQAIRIEHRREGEDELRDPAPDESPRTHVPVDVSVGDALDLTLSWNSGAESAGGPVTLHLVAAPESSESRELASELEGAYEEATRIEKEGKIPEARTLVSEALEWMSESGGAPYSEAVHDALWLLGYRAYVLGLVNESLLAWGEAERHCRRTLPPTDAHLLTLQLNIAAALRSTGAVREASDLERAVLAVRERILPPDHPDLLNTRMNLANTLQALGDLEGAHELCKSVFESREKTLPEDHPLRLKAGLNFANSLRTLGDLEGSRVLLESVVETLARTQPRGASDRLKAEASLATTYFNLGRSAQARACYEEVLVVFEERLPAEHPSLLAIKANLALTMKSMGDIAGARVLQQALLEVFVRTLPEGDSRTLHAKQNLAASMSAMGDLEGARALLEETLEDYERTLPFDDPGVLAARHSLATSLRRMGEYEEALALNREIVQAYEQKGLPPDHPSLLTARGGLAAGLNAVGDREAAIELQRAVLEQLEHKLPPEDLSYLIARHNLATYLHDVGRVEEALEHERFVLAERERVLPADHPDLLRVRHNLAYSLYRSGHDEELREQLLQLARGIQARLGSALALSPRQTRQVLAEEDSRLGALFSLAGSEDAALSKALFELTETMRVVATEAARSLSLASNDAVLAPLLEEAAELRRRQGELTSRAGQGQQSGEEFTSELTRGVVQLDRIEGTVRRHLAELGVRTDPLTLESLHAALGEGEALIGFRSVPIRQLREEDRMPLARLHHMLVHVVDSGGQLTRLDLGLISELEELAGSWRTALGASVGDAASRGVLLEDSAETSSQESGLQLRQRLLDPILAVVGEDVQRIYLCADDLVYILPLDALPLDAEGNRCLGDRVQIIQEVSFARLLAPTKTDHSGSLLTLGGVDYDAPADVEERYVAVTPPISELDGTRSGAPLVFSELAGTEPEAVSTAALFEENFELEPVILKGEHATKAALFRAAEGKRFLHLATHGWFAPDTVQAGIGSEESSSERESFDLGERVAGFAPMTLCGLALTGANAGMDSLGRVPGIVTAEELCTVDLTGCELAVLSACETNVGKRRAGQGIQSLQAALHAAGASSSLTSLWKVDDAATQRLMELFYTKLWSEGLPKAEALWAAKVALREAGHPPAHWAGWVMTGAPD